MELKKSSMAGTLESSDIQIYLHPNAGKGVQIFLDSDVKELFGTAIENTIREVLHKFSIQNVTVEAHDKGALDVVIRSRMECAVTRALEMKYDWSQED